MIFNRHNLLQKCLLSLQNNKMIRTSSNTKQQIVFLVFECSFKYNSIILYYIILKILALKP